MHRSSLVPVLATVAAVSAIAGCKRTGRGTYEVQKPVVGTQTDTVHTPTVDVTTHKDTVNVPQVEVKKKPTTVNVPNVRVHHR